MDVRAHLATLARDQNEVAHIDCRRTFYFRKYIPAPPSNCFRPECVNFGSEPTCALSCWFMCVCCLCLACVRYGKISDYHLIPCRCLRACSRISAGSDVSEISRSTPCSTASGASSARSATPSSPTTSSSFGRDTSWSRRPRITMCAVGV